MNNTFVLKNFNTQLNNYFFYHKPTFLSGFANCIDWLGLNTHFTKDDLKINIDEFSIKSDWETVGNDLYSALNLFVENNPILNEKINLDDI